MLSIYKASAGSGKTFTLAYEYIKMLLGRKNLGDDRYRLDTRSGRRHRSILAITFTNKATEEMKRRIVHELAVIAGAEPGWNAPSPYIDKLCRDLGASPEQVAAEARRALAELLFDYGFFAVSTIDSFFQQVLRTFAREADLTGNYEVDLDNDGLIDLAIAQIFRSLEFKNDTDTRRTAMWLAEFLRARMMNGDTVELFNRNSELFRSLHRFIKNTLNETFTIHSDALMAFLADPQATATLAKAISERIASAKAAMTDQCRRAVAAIGGREGVKQLVVSALTKYADASVRDIKISDTFRAVASDPSTAVKKDKKSLHLRDDGALMAALADAADAAVECHNVVRALKPIDRNIHFLGLLSAVIREMDSIKRDNNMLLLSDTGGILSKIIGDDETPFLYERMGVWIENFLIDEFQDTSLMQWRNLKPLLAEGLATDRDSLIIGDEKQCIYRFRSSDPTLLQHQVQDQFGNAARVHGDTAEGNTNWRSSATVVEFNNAFFSHVAASGGMSDIYANVVQEVSKSHSDHSGYVSVVAAGGSSAEAAAIGYERMADEIARQIASGYNASDIVVLGRNKTHTSGAIAHLLARQASDPDYPRFRIISDESIEVGKSQAVKLIISVMKSLLLSRPDRECASATSERRRRSYTLEEIVLARLINDYEYGCARGMSPEAALAKALQASRLPDDDPSVCRPANPAEGMVCPNLQTLVDRIIATFIDPAALNHEHIYITALQDLVSSFAMRGGADLREFLKWWDATGSHTAVASPQAADTLRVMTIHKSKGLEFKCVHIPVCDWDTGTFKDAEWFEVTGDIAGIDATLFPPLIPMRPSSDMEGTPFEAQYLRRKAEVALDETNTLYVAFTRAVDELIVTYSPSRASRMGSVVNLAIEMMGGTDGSYVAGEPTTPRSSRRATLTATEPTEAIDLTPRVPADRASLWADTRLDLPADPLTPRGRGIMLHDVLARIGHKDELPRAVRQMVSRGVVPHAMAPDIMATLGRELERPEVSDWFSGFKRYMTERPLAIDTSGAEHRRPDRVVWTADGHVDVIDYKSGEERPAAHRRQVAFYMNHLRKLGYKKVRGFIWYLDSGEIMPVAPG